VTRARRAMELSFRNPLHKSFMLNIEARTE